MKAALSCLDGMSRRLLSQQYIYYLDDTVPQSPQLGNVGAGGPWRADSPLPPAVILLEVAKMHLPESYSWCTEDLEAGPRSPTLSLMFFKSYRTLPLSTTSTQKSNSGRHFLDLAQQELKEKVFGVCPEISREFIPSPCPTHCILQALASLLTQGYRLAAWELAVCRFSAPCRWVHGFHLKPTFSTSLKNEKIWQHWAHISAWVQLAGAKEQLLSPFCHSLYCSISLYLGPFTVLPAYSLVVLVSVTHRSEWGALSLSVSSQP